MALLNKPHLLWFFVVACFLKFKCSHQENSQENKQIADFLHTIEHLLNTTTDSALEITKNVYLNLSSEMPPALRNSTEKLRLDYVRDVDEVLQTSGSYMAKRRLFAKYKRINEEIEQLRRQLAPQNEAAYQYELISNEFYLNGDNRTAFDNLYLDFMASFERASQRLWAELSERTVEEAEEMLEILDEISKEKQLREKDKLYDEFIEMYLTKGKEANNSEEGTEGMKGN